MAGHSIEGLMRWLERDEWRAPFEDVVDEHFGDACETIDGSMDDLEKIIGVSYLATLWGCAFEDFLTRRGENGENLVADYLKRRGFRESASTRAYMIGLSASAMSLYEVSDVRPGESFLARDLIRGGEPVRVSERSGSQQLKPWDRIGARIVPLSHKTVMGGGVLLFDHEDSETLLGLVRNAEAALPRKIAWESETDILPVVAPMFTALWLGSLLEKILEPVRPDLRNSDGDALLLTTLRYSLKSPATVASVRAALDQVVGLVPAGRNFWNWLDVRTAGPGAAKSSVSRGLVVNSWMEDGSTILGTIEIRRRAVFLDVNSSERATKGQALIEAALKGLVAAPEIATHDLGEQRPGKPPDDDVAPPEIPPEEQLAVMQEWMDRHYRAVLDERVPMLDDKTPRELARTAAGRVKLVEWLKYIENGAARAMARGSMVSYDLGWMWNELGVADLRR